jgi:hypothetical protein
MPKVGGSNPAETLNISISCGKISTNTRKFGAENFQT